jgi:sulfate transport system permease protein
MPVWRQRSVLPGFGLTLGFTLAYLGLIVLIPLGALFVRTAGVGWQALWAELTSPRTLAAFRISFGLSALAALANAVFGLLVAWVLVRYSFPGQRLIGAVVDLPFALPTAVAGIALTALYSDTGWIGGLLAPLGSGSRRSASRALIFVGLPFVVRTVEPVLRELDSMVEAAAALLGARRWQILVRVVCRRCFRHC